MLGCLGWFFSGGHCVAGATDPLRLSLDEPLYEVLRALVWEFWQLIVLGRLRKVDHRRFHAISPRVRPIRSVAYHRPARWPFGNPRVKLWMRGQGSRLSRCRFHLASYSTCLFKTTANT